MDKIYKVWIKRFGCNFLAGSALGSNERQALSNFRAEKGLDILSASSYSATLDVEATREAGLV